MKKLTLCAAVLVFLSTPVLAADRGFFGGLGIYSQNSFNKTTKSDEGSGSLFGAYSFPLIARYAFEVSKPWLVAPALYYTPIGRSSGGGTATTTFLHLSIPATYHVSASSRDFEFFFGPGLSMYQMKGAGGTKQLSNGTSTSTYAVPGGDSTSKLVTLDLGVAWLQDRHRISFEIFVEGLASSEKRAFNLLAAYMYHFGG